jgi:hypothetical protein
MMQRLVYHPYLMLQLLHPLQLHFGQQLSYNFLVSG